MFLNHCIIGGGISGITLAQKLSEKKETVLIIEKRHHIGGNCYDFEDSNGILIHQYGPHIFHTNDEDVWNYLSRFTSFTDYRHTVVGWVDDILVPIPFNLDSLYLLLPEDYAKKIEKTLLLNFPLGSRVSIFELKELAKSQKNPDLIFIADFIFEKVFKNYTIKQWGCSVEKLDNSVLKRVPVVISRENYYFSDKYQGMPQNGYSVMFNNMLSSKYISILLNTDYRNILNGISYDKLYVTGPIDEFFDYEFGKLDYRKTLYKFETHNVQAFQSGPVVNYPNTELFTRATEMKWFYPEAPGFFADKTVVCTEYPGIGQIDAYPIENNENKSIYSLYEKKAKQLNNVFFFGRLANYRYINMDQAVKQVLDYF